MITEYMTEDELLRFREGVIRKFEAMKTALVVARFIDGLSIADNVKEANIYTARMQIALEMAKFISKESKAIRIKDLAARSVEFADALIEELKK